jgi:hypothetical protein
MSSLSVQAVKEWLVLPQRKHWLIVQEFHSCVSEAQTAQGEMTSLLGQFIAKWPRSWQR